MGLELKRERFGIELCIASQPQEYILVEAIGVDEIEQEKCQGRMIEPQRSQTPQEEHHAEKEWPEDGGEPGERSHRSHGKGQYHAEGRRASTSKRLNCNF